MAHVGGAIADAFAAAASAASGSGAGVVAAADASSLSQADLDHMDSLEVENSGEIEMNGIMYAVDYMNDHWKMLTEADDAATLVLAGSKAEDDRLYREFRAAFGSMDVTVTKNETLKDTRTQETWRAFMMSQDGRMDEFNMISLLRIDSGGNYDDANTLLVPRVQFLAIEIARNREGINDCAKLKEQLVLVEIADIKAELKDAINTDEPAAVVSLLKKLAADYPILPRHLLQKSGMARYVHTQCVPSADPAVAATAKSLERQWKSGVVMKKLCTDTNGEIATAAQYVVDRWQGGAGAAAAPGGAAALAKGGVVDQTRLAVNVSEAERAAEQLDSATVDAAAEQFERDGVLYVENALSPKLLAHAAAAVDGCCEFLSERLQQFGHTYAGDTFAFAEVQYRDGARLDNRLLIEQTICGSEIIAQHPLWYPIVQKLLSTATGGDPQLLFAGVVDAYPYDRPHAQDWHRDGQALSSDPAVQLPSHCLNLFIPLVDITEEVGPTEFWPGTHIESTFHALKKEQKVDKTPTPEATADAATATILAPAGSVILFDYRTIHRGGANKSGKQRRVLYLTYATKSFADAKNFAAPSILEDKPGKSTALPQEIWEQGGMGAFHHVLRLRQLDMSVPRSWCDVGNDLYTSRYGLLLASAYLKNERLAFDPSKYSPEGVGAEAAAGAMLDAAADPAAWARMMAAEGDEMKAPHDVALLRNAAACSRFERRVGDVEDSIRQFLMALCDEDAQKARLACFDLYFANRRAAFTAGAAFVAPELEGRFGGSKDSYCFGICKDGKGGLGYYLDAGGETMDPSVVDLLAAFKALPPPLKQVNDTSGELSAGLDEVVAAPVVELDEEGRGCSVETELGLVSLGDLCIIAWEYEDYEAEAVKIDLATMAIVWRYTPSPHWDEWAESIPLHDMLPRGLVMKKGKTGEHYLVYQKEEAEVAAAAAAAPPPVENPLSLPAAPEGDAALAVVEEEEEDFADGGVDAAASLQLEALAVERTADILQEYGFTRDGAGFRAMLAVAKSVSGGEHAAEMEEAVTSWMHGGLGRFELVESDTATATSTLVVVFSSLGNGVIRPEFRGSLKPPAPGAEENAAAATPVAAEYDVLYVIDPARSWYSQDPRCNWSGFAYFEAEISLRIANGGYNHVLMMGDSMGGSGALLFSHLATRVLAFVPQCELEEYPMCSRHDFTATGRKGFSARLLESVGASSATIGVHLGEDDEDERQLQWLLDGLGGSGDGSDGAKKKNGERVSVVRYPEIAGHHVSGSLKESGELVPLVQREILAAAATTL